MLGPGHVLHNRYQIVQVLGQGATGTIYLADDLQRDRPVAVRELRPGRPTAAFHPADIRLFQREAYAFQGLRHPNLSRVHEFLKGSHACYLVMDFVAGRPLSEVLADEGPQYENRVLDWVQQLCGAFRYLHGCRPPVILRELEPGNIVLRDDGLIRIVDFGIARSCGLGIGFDRRSGTRGMASGGSRAPGGESMPDVLSNLYSLGTLIHCLLSGDLPPSAQDPSRGAPGLVDLRRVRPDVSENTVRAVEAMVHPDRSVRLPSIDAVILALGLTVEDWVDNGEDLEEPPPRRPVAPAPDAELERFLARSIRIEPSGVSPEGVLLPPPVPMAPSAAPTLISPPSTTDDVPPEPAGRGPDPEVTAARAGAARAPDSAFADAVKHALEASAPAAPPDTDLKAAVKSAVVASASTRAAARATSRARSQAPAPALPLSRLLLVAPVALVLILAGWWVMRGGRHQPGSSMSPTILEVTSLPELSRVYVDDTDCGVTPLRLTTLAPGRHDIRIEHPSHVTARYMIQLREGKTRTMRVVLQKEGEAPITIPPPAPGPGESASPTPGSAVSGSPSGAP